MKHFIWIDDIREMPACREATAAFWAKSYKEAIAYLNNMVHQNLDAVYISFDHDLGGNKSGYDVAKWLVEHSWVGNYDVHSMNPVGAANIKQLLDHYGWEHYPKHYEYLQK